MLEALTLDQLRLFLSVAEQGSFSAAGRKLGRVQSAVSQGIANLEEELEVLLFDRSTRKPTLTEAGNSLLVDAQQIFEKVDALRVRAAGISEGLESELSLVVDTIVPASILVNLARAFQSTFPTVALRIHTETLNTVVALVLDGRCLVGLAGPVGLDAKNLRRRFVTNILTVPVVAKTHALATLAAPIPSSAFLDQTQIVISEHRKASGPDHNVLSPQTWRVAEAATKHALILAGLGWGKLPVEMVQDDLASGALVKLHLQEWGSQPTPIPLSSIIRTDTAPGPAAQWLLAYLDELGTAGLVS